MRYKTTMLTLFWWGTKRQCRHSWWGTKRQCTFDEVQNDRANTLDEVQNDSALFWWSTKRQCRHSFDEVQNDSALLMRYKTTVQTILMRYKTTVQTILMRYKTTVHSFDEVQNDSADSLWKTKRTSAIRLCWEISLMKRQECTTQTRVNIPVSTKLYQPTSCFCLVLETYQPSVCPYPNQAVY